MRAEGLRPPSLVHSGPPSSYTRSMLKYYCCMCVSASYESFRTLPRSYGTTFVFGRIAFRSHHVDERFLRGGVLSARDETRSSPGKARACRHSPTASFPAVPRSSWAVELSPSCAPRVPVRPFSSGGGPPSSRTRPMQKYYCCTCVSACYESLFSTRGRDETPRSSLGKARGKCLRFVRAILSRTSTV